MKTLPERSRVSIKIGSQPYNRALVLVIDPAEQGGVNAARVN